MYQARRSVSSRGTPKQRQRILEIGVQQRLMFDQGERFPASAAPAAPARSRIGHVAPLAQVNRGIEEAARSHRRKRQPLGKRGSGQRLLEQDIEEAQPLAVY
jgi:hypothetical protein